VHHRPLAHEEERGLPPRHSSGRHVGWDVEVGDYPDVCRRAFFLPIGLASHFRPSRPLRARVAPDRGQASSGADGNPCFRAVRTCAIRLAGYWRGGPVPIRRRPAHIDPRARGLVLQHAPTPSEEKGPARARAPTAVMKQCHLLQAPPWTRAAGPGRHAPGGSIRSTRRCWRVVPAIANAMHFGGFSMTRNSKREPAARGATSPGVLPSKS